MAATSCGSLSRLARDMTSHYGEPVNSRGAISMTSPAEGDNAPVRQTSSRSMTGASPSIGSITAPVGGCGPSERRQRERLAVALIVEMPPAGNQAVLVDIVGLRD